MKNKQHEYILKAFLKSSIPTTMRRSAPELMAIDSVIGGYCFQLTKREKCIELQSNEIISKTEKATFSERNGKRRIGSVLSACDTCGVYIDSV